MSSPRRILVLYGSETGNAQDVAERVVREAKGRHYSPVVMPMDRYNICDLPSERRVVFVTSTTGQGDEPRNMKGFWRFLLRKSLAATSLTSMSYAVFGLGDSGYQKYNVTAKKLFRRLEGLGANAVQALGLGDDQHPLGYEAALNPWLGTLWLALRETCPLPVGLQDPSDEDIAKVPLPSSRFTVAIVEPPSDFVSGVDGKDEQRIKTLTEAQRALKLAVAAADASDAGSSSFFSIDAFQAQEQLIEGVFEGMVVENERLTSDDAVKEVRHLEFKSQDSREMKYEAGDVLGITPHSINVDDARLLSLIGRLKMDPEAWVRVYPSSTPEMKHVVPSVRLKHLIAGAIDIHSASPRRYFFEVMSHFAGSSLEKERLQYFASAEGAVDLYKYNQRERRTVVEIFDDFPSLQPSLAWLLQVAPHLHPRYYSISSSPSDTASTGSVHITVAAVDWTTPMKRRRQGLCSSWLASLRVGDQVRYTVGKGNIVLPPLEVPLILVGPGTGIAPFRSFTRERMRQIQVACANGGGETLAPSPTLIIVGCRDANLDYLYKDEWEAVAADAAIIGKNGLGGVVAAFSRMQHKKQYVQDRIKDESGRIWALLESGAKVFVAGSAEKMPAAVHDAIRWVVQTRGSMSEDESARYMIRLGTSGRYFVDAW